MTSVGIEPKRLGLVHASYSEPAKMVLVEGRKRGAVGLKVDLPLHVYKCKTIGKNRDYKDEVLRIYAKKSRGAGQWLCHRGPDWPEIIDDQSMGQ